MSRALLYIRVSTDEQAEEGYSLEAQERICRRKADEGGHLPGDLYADEGLRASTLNRPALQRLLTEMQRGDCIYLWRLDRLSRDMEDTMGVLKRLRRAGVELVSVTEGRIDVATAAGILNAGVRAVFNQYERALIGERTSLGLIRRVEKGKPYPKPPFGYLRASEGGGDTWTIHDEEAAVVRQLAAWRLEGNGYYRIARLAEQHGMMAPEGNRWYQGAVRVVLTNPAYGGYARYGPLLLPHAVPAILAPDVFHRLQAINQARSKSRARFESPYLLGGIVFCACGARMQTGTKIARRRPDGSTLKHQIYRCNRYAVHYTANHNNTVKARDLDLRVLRTLDGLDRDAPPGGVILPAPQSPDVTRRLADLNAELTRLEEGLIRGRIRADMFDEHRERILRERTAAESAGSEWQDRIARERRLFDAIRRRVGHMMDTYLQSGPTPGMKGWLQSYVARVEVGLPDGSRRGLDSRELTIRLHAPE